MSCVPVKEAVMEAALLVISFDISAWNYGGKFIRVSTLVAVMATISPLFHFHGLELGL